MAIKDPFISYQFWGSFSQFRGPKKGIFEQLKEKLGKWVMYRGCMGK